MIGIDVLEIKRVSEMSEHFLDRVFSEREREYILVKSNAPETVAGLFCAKEAVLKALGCGIGCGVRLHDVEILHRQSGQPYVELKNEAKLLLNTLGESVSLSISHDGGYAVAVAHVEK